MIYFVYTANSVPGVGGVTPQGVRIGIAAHKNIKAGCCSDPLDLLSISEFSPIIVTEDEAMGLNLVGLTEINDVMGGDIRPLNDVELARQAAAEKLVKKLRARFRINAEVGDAQDLLADVAKRLAMLERMVMLMAHEQLNGVAIDQATKDLFMALVKNYVDGISADTLKDRIDLEDTAELFNRLGARATAIAGIIAEEYAL